MDAFLDVRPAERRDHAFGGVGGRGLQAAVQTGVDLLLDLGHRRGGALGGQGAGELSNFLDMSDDLLTEPLDIRDGELAIRPGAGLGVDIDPAKLEHYRQDA